MKQFWAPWVCFNSINITGDGISKNVRLITLEVENKMDGEFFKIEGWLKFLISSTTMFRMLKNDYKLRNWSYFKIN